MKEGVVNYSLLRRGKAYRTGLKLHQCRLHIAGWYTETYVRWNDGDLLFEADVPEDKITDRVVHDILMAMSYVAMPQEAGPLNFTPIHPDFIENTLAASEDDFISGLLYGLYIGIHHEEE